MSDENIIRVTYDPANPPKGRTDWAKVAAMTEEEINEAALSDPDAQPLTEEELSRMRRVPNVAAIRKKLKISQAEFAERFRLPLQSVRDWEERKAFPRGSDMRYLWTIEYAPKTVENAMKPRRTPLKRKHG